MIRTLWFSALTIPRQVLVRLCQQVNFGIITGLEICGGEPVFSPEPTVLVDHRLDCDECPRREVELQDFLLTDEVRRLMSTLDQIGNGVIERLEIRAGLPRRLVFPRKLAGTS